MIDLSEAETVPLVRETCCTCGVVFAFPRRLYEHLREDPSKWFYCPNGHQQHYTGETKAERERRLRERAERALKIEHDALVAERSRHDQTRASLRAQKGVNTRIKNRIKNGVCPCCNRTFQNLARHMANQHPDFTPESIG